LFTWTKKKNILNKKKHGIYLSEVVDVFNDPYLIERYDKEHSTIEEDRYICLGKLHDKVVLFVVFTERGDYIHLIMARKAEPPEERLYYEHYEEETGGN